jgi:4-hydroxy-tetrahydrodipicolinate reductase
MSERLAVLGANGKMGRAVIRIAHAQGMKLVAAIGAGDDLGKDAGELAGVGALGVKVSGDLQSLKSSGAHVLVDFSTPAVVTNAIEVCASAGIAIASGTTGLGEAENKALDAASSKVAVLWEPNMSVGIYVLSQLVAQAIKALGSDFDIEIVEAHHRLKVDAPSGTALRLAEVAKKARDEASASASHFVTGRDGKPGARKQDEIGVLAMRGGDVIGDHLVHLLGDGERIELTHRASNRDLFARGAVRAGRWLVGKPAGRYSLSDVLA